MTAHLCGAQQSAAVLDGGDVGAGAAHLEEDAVADAQVHERGGDTGGGAGEKGEQRPPAQVLHGHHPSIAAHHHQWRGDRDLPHRPLHHLRGGDGPWEQACVDHRGAGAHSQAVPPRDLMRSGGGQARLLGGGDDHFLTGGIVNREGLGGDDGLRTPCRQLLHRRHRRALAHPLPVEIGMESAQRAAGRQLEVAKASLCVGALSLQPRPDRHDPNQGDIAFQQGIGDLGGAVGEKADLRGGNPRLRQQAAEGLHHSLRHPRGGAVCGGRLRLSGKGVVTRVQGDGMGESASDIYPDAVAWPHHAARPQMLRSSARMPLR